MSSNSNDKAEESVNWVEEIRRELEKIGEMFQGTETGISAAEVIDKINSAANEGKKMEEEILRENAELKKQLGDQNFLLCEMEMERDVLLQQVHTYLEMNSSLRIRLEEQRCQTGALKNQLAVDLESRIRTLERDKEELTNLNEEKEKEVDKMRSMLEQRRRRKEGGEESDVTTLKRDLQRALEDKMKVEGRLRKVLTEQRKAAERCWTGRKKGSGLRRSVSEGDFGRENFECFEKSIVLEGPRECIANCKLNEKTNERSVSKQTDYSAEAETKKSELTVHSQLDALKRGLFNVTRKLELLKIQLINSGAIKEEAKESQRNLKRKARTMETEENSAEESQSDFKNLKNILEDARRLNAKLENLREEKVKTIGLTKKEKGVQVEIKKNEAWSQATETGRYFQKTIARLKRAVCQCEAELGKGSIGKEEAFAAFTSALVFFILSNMRYFSLGRLSLTDHPVGEEGSNESKENGGGDNLLKLYDNPYNELKIQMARLKLKIELFETLKCAP